MEYGTFVGVAESFGRLQAFLEIGQTAVVFIGAKIGVAKHVGRAQAVVMVARLGEIRICLRQRGNGISDVDRGSVNHAEFEIDEILAFLDDLLLIGGRWGECN